MSVDQELLRVERLTISFPGRAGRVAVVDDISFAVAPDETVGLVGESGSGKTVSALEIMRLSRSPARVERGEVWFQGANLRAKNEQEMCQIWGRSISMVFQSARSALNPLLPVGDQIARAFQIQRKMGRKEAHENAQEMLRLVGIPDVQRLMHSYPHQLSGGMCQRVVIAMMMACRPALLIADEPTTGLDVTVQAQIFELIKQVQQERRMAMLLITHDLGVIAELCKRVVVMYAGHVLETGTADRLFAEPCHPYTRMLLGSVLRVDRAVRVSPPGRAAIEGITYSSTACRFAQRCQNAEGICWTQKPTTVTVGPRHTVMCHLYSAGKT